MKNIRSPIVSILVLGLCIAASVFIAAPILQVKSVSAQSMNSGQKYDIANLAKVIAQYSSGNTLDNFLVNGPIAGQFIPQGPFTVAGATVPAPTYITGWSLYNKAAYPVYLHLYNKDTVPVCGTDVPVITIELPATSTTSDTLKLGQAILFIEGFGYSLSKGYADTDNVSAASGDVVGYISWKSGST